jgi:hypothetical protein
MENWIGSGYTYDGVEGYVYPKSAAQPPGMVKLCRKFDGTRQDYVLFPGGGTNGSDCSATTDGYSGGAYTSDGAGDADWIAWITPAQANVIGEKLGGYLSGNWYNPGNGGHGFQLELTNTIDAASGLPIMVAIWFVYAPDDSGSQRWIYAQGPYDPAASVVTLAAVLTGGARFPPAFSAQDVESTPWGSLMFSFSDCDHGAVMWNSSLPGYGGGTLSIARLTQIGGTSCP